MKTSDGTQHLRKNHQCALPVAAAAAAGVWKNGNHMGCRKEGN
jgi:hypothetical protein